MSGDARRAAGCRAQTVAGALESLQEAAGGWAGAGGGVQRGAEGCPTRACGKGVGASGAARGPLGSEQAASSSSVVILNTGVGLLSLPALGVIISNIRNGGFKFGPKAL